MNHVLDRITGWLRVNGDASDDGKSFTINSKDGPNSKFIAGLHLCDGHELLHIGQYRTVNAESCSDPEIVFQIRDGEFTYMVPPDSREDGDYVDCTLIAKGTLFGMSSWAWPVICKREISYACNCYRRLAHVRV